MQMNKFLLLTAGSAQSMNSSASLWTMVVVYAVLIAALYFIFFRPQSKKRKKEEKMRKGVQVGDEITTIGGISGRVVGIKDENETLVIETGTDRSKLRIKRWAIGSVETIHDDAQ